MTDRANIPDPIKTIGGVGDTDQALNAEVNYWKSQGFLMQGNPWQSGVLIRASFIYSPNPPTP